MKGKLFKKALAVATSVLMLSGGVSAQPFADIFKDMAITANAETTTSTVNVGGTDYTLFTGFTATGGNGKNYAKLVDGNTSTDWIATKNYDDPNAPANDFAGGTADPAFVEFHADAPFIPKGYVLTCDHEFAGFWKPVEWALKARLNESDGWTTIQSSTTTLGQGKTFEIACDNDGDNEYQYFRFEVYEVGTTMTVDLDELQFYGLLPAYTHLTVKAATCMATGIKVDCYRRNSDGKYFTDNTGETELAESDVIAPIIPHTGEHHEATDVNIEYWQCSMCGKYFSDEGCTTEITEEQTKIYRTITIDNSISGLVEVAFSKTQALAGESIILYVDYQVDASTLKVNDGAVELTAKTDIQYTFTMPAADVTVTADVAQSNADGDILTGSIRHTVTIPYGASITLNNATITGGIVCNGTATITLVGTNSVSGATNKAGIQVGGSGTTLTIRGDGSLTVTGGAQSAGIGLSRAWNVTEDVVGGNIVINGGNITANGGGGGAGIGAGVTKDPNNSSSRKAIVGTITIAGGSVTAVGGSNADGIGAGENNYNATIQIGTVTIYDGINKVDASSIKDFANVVYMHGNDDVTANKTDYFTIGEDSNRRLIVQKPVIAEIAEQAYTGSAVTPEPQVTIGSLNLTKGTDYVYSYTNNTNFGTATVRATFQGDYASLGYVEKEFTILPSTVIVNVTGNGTVTYNDKSAASGETIGVTAEKGTDVTLTLAPESGYAVSIEYGYTNNSGTTASGFKLPINGTTATLTVPNDLKDGTYVNLTVTFVSALAGGADEASAVALTDNTVTNFAGGWYKVDSDITFDHTLNLLGDTHLIIDDGKTMTVNTATDRGILSDYTLFVISKGALNVATTDNYGIAVRVGNYVQTGATVTASGYIGIRCEDDFIGFDFDNDFTFSGGQLTATGSGGGGIDADNDITLSCTNATDFIQASSYNGTIKVADGKMFKNGSDEYSGTLSNNEIKGKKLIPATKTLKLPTSITGGTLIADQSENVLVGDTVTLTVTPDAGYTLKSLTVMNGETAVAVENNQFTMPAGDVTVSAVFEEIPTPKLLEANTVSFKDNLTLNFLASIDESLTDGAYVKFTYNHYGEEQVVTCPINTLDKNGDEYRFRCELTASEMAITVKADLYLKDSIEPISTWSRSIRDYCIAGLNSDQASDKEKALFRATLNYGGYTQKNFGYNAEPYAYTDYQDSMDTVTITSAVAFARPEGVINGIEYTGATVFFRNAPYIRYYFKLADGANINDYTFSISGQEITPTKKGSEYYIESAPVLAYQLDNAQNVVVTKANAEVFNFNYSIIKWAETAAEKTTNADERNMVKAMFAYYQAAKAFVESNS